MLWPPPPGGARKEDRMRKNVQARIRDLSECMLRRPDDRSLRRQLQSIRKAEEKNRRMS